jgi:hypothetical protein
LRDGDLARFRNRNQAKPPPKDGTCHKCHSIQRDTECCRNPMSCFGTDFYAMVISAIWDLLPELVPYQELSGRVLVWHAECYRKGNIGTQIQNLHRDGKDRLVSHS